MKFKKNERAGSAPEQAGFAFLIKEVSAVDDGDDDNKNTFNYLGGIRYESEASAHRRVQE